MKKSMIISFKKIMSKALSFLLLVTLSFGCLYFDLPSRLFSKMANDSLNPNRETLKSRIEHMFSLEFPKTVLAAMPIIPATPNPTVAPILPESTPTPVTEPAPVAKDISGQSSQQKNPEIQIKNHAGKTFSTEQLLKKPLSYQPDTGGYKVLIVHSHTTESYLPDDRSNDETKNMIQVGKEFTAVLEKNGIKTLHVTKVHDVPYTTSYKKSLESVTKALEEHPSIEVVIDIHRDALYSENNEKIKPLANINGESAAQVMIVTGTEKGGLPHPNWEENLSFAIKLQNDLMKNFPGLSRPIDLRKERFNTHTTKNSIIFEIGSNGNTIEEAIAGAKLAAQSVANVLLGK